MAKGAAEGVVGQAIFDKFAEPTRLK